MKSKFPDIIYILGNGSISGNFEIKYSLRSIEQHLKEYRNVFIIGTKPYFLNDKAIEVPFKDSYANKARNIMAKILRAANDTRITNEFLLFNDDYFLLQDVLAPNYPYYYKGTLQHAVEVNIGEYSKHCQSTLDALIEKKCDTKNFDAHYPIIYNKRNFIKMVENFNWNKPFGNVVKSTYCNWLEVEGIFKEDCKISHPYGTPAIKALNEGRIIFSTGEKGLNNAMKKYLQELFPDKSSFEI